MLYLKKQQKIMATRVRFFMFPLSPLGRQMSGERALPYPSDHHEMPCEIIINFRSIFLGSRRHALSKNTYISWPLYMVIRTTHISRYCRQTHNLAFEKYRVRKYGIPGVNIPTPLTTYVTCIAPIAGSMEYETTVATAAGWVPCFVSPFITIWSE